MQSVNKPVVRHLPPTLSDADVKAQLERETQNSVTAAELKPEQPRFTAQHVDQNQTTKLYHGRSAPFAFVESPEIAQTEQIQHCRKDIQALPGPAGTEQKKCVGGFKTATIRATALSCIYRNEGDGKFYRVLHNSKYFEAPLHRGGTPMMQQKVCGGHTLNPVHEGGFTTWKPSQTDKEGNTLYLNPAHIIDVRPLTPEESAKLKRK